MTVATQRHPSTIVLLDDEVFFLAKDQDGVPQWSPVQVQTQEGDPMVPRQWKWQDWSRGLGDSRGWFRGAVEYCENVWLGSMGRIIPGPDITEIDTANTAEVRKIIEVTAPANRLLVFGGTAVRALDPAHAVTTDGTVAADVLDAELFYDKVAVALGDAVDFAYRDAAGAYATTTLSGFRARAFGISAHGLVRGWSFYWSKCEDPDFYSVDNWTADYPIGDPSAVINDVFGQQRWDYVLKDEGLYTFDEENSDDVGVLNDLALFRGPENRYWFAWDDQLFICSVAGLYRYIAQGAARAVGIEEVENNEGELSNVYPTAGVAFGRWAYVAYYKPATGITYIVAMRRAQDGDTGFGSPYTVVSVIDRFSGRCLVMGPVSDISGSYRLYYGAATKVRHFQVSRDGNPVTYRDNGTGLVWFNPTDCGNPHTVKYPRSIEAIVSGLGPTRPLQWMAELDRNAIINVDDPVLLTGTGQYMQVFFAPEDAARFIQLGLEVDFDGGGVPDIRDVTLNYEDRPEQTTGAMATLRLRDFDQEGEVSTRKTAKEMLDKLESLIESGAFEVTDPYGDTYLAAVQRAEGSPAYTRRGDAPQLNMQVVVRRLDYA